MRQDITRTLTSSANTVQLTMYGLKYDASNGRTSETTLTFNKGVDSWVDQDVEDDYDGGPSQGFFMVWKNYSLVVDGVTVIKEESISNCMIPSKTVRIGSIDYIITYEKK